jgi:molybdenum cofactor biosynthesis enzyme MoaA
MSVERNSEHGSHLLHVRKDCGNVVSLWSQRASAKWEEADGKLIRTLGITQMFERIYPPVDKFCKKCNRLQVARDPAEDRHPHFENHCS